MPRLYGQRDHGRARRARELCGAVGGAVVDDDDLEVGVGMANLGHDLRDGASLVECRNDRSLAHVTCIGR